MSGVCQRNDQYSRTQLAQITREINKLLPQPIMVLFKHGATLTLAVINRRLNKRDAAKDVLEKVTLIKDITWSKPHRAHVEILFDLSLAQLRTQHTITDFASLHAAWAKVLDSVELNKRFYREVADWFFWASEQVTFPDGAGSDRDVRNKTSLIRLITRLIFVWFLKERDLVPDDLFNQERLATLLRDWTHDATDQSTYYKAILQNLFFATLNTPMDDPKLPRKFRARSASGGRDGNYMAHNVYRYEDMFADSAAALAVFRNIPFLNGGLFECLDRPAENDTPELRIDGFSDKPSNPLRVPNDLFFGKERTVDLSTVYGTKAQRKVRGLIDILNRYKFTIAENTPIEEEVALDPELLGRVFENLLAAYNPETGTTARKQTGSFYTPREIVNYMVDESLSAYLTTTLLDGTDQISDEQRRDVERRLRHLLAYTDEQHNFTPTETSRLIAAIDACKILDPACGSGAFPMGVLHKLVFLLARLDPRNQQWKQRQISKVDVAIAAAQEIDDSDRREQSIAALEDQKREIEIAFGRNELDYGRKLFLIENCIYGVDIQPIAVQIAKLRCFISLIVDQRIDDRMPNRNVRSLPNLETKFVAANTLIGLPQQGALRSTEVVELEENLADVRRKHFTARTPQTKRRYREQDQQLREQIGTMLIEENVSPETARQLALWNPYDLNGAADFFDPQWMFGVDGFDIVIGNPPYGAEVPKHELKLIKKSMLHTTNSNSAALFIDYAKNKLRRSNGCMTFIVPKSILYSEKWLSLSFALLEATGFLVDVEKAFEKVKLEQVVFVYSPQFMEGNYIARKFLNDTFMRTTAISKAYPKTFQAWICDVSANDIELALNAKHRSVELATIAKSFRGFPLQKYIQSTGCPVIGGDNIGRFSTQGVKGYIPLELLTNLGKVASLKNPKIMAQNIVAHIQKPSPHIKIIATIDEDGSFTNLDTVTNIVVTSTNYNLKFVLALLNSKFLNWYAYKFIFCSAIRTMHFDDYYVGKLPIPTAIPEQQAPIVTLVERILEAKRADAKADVQAWEREIDQLVYALYGLDESEIAVVEGR